MKKLKQLSVETIRSWGPCYDPTRYLSESWKGTVLDLLGDSRIPAHDRLWCALRTSLVSEKTMRLYAVKAARKVEHFMNDKRSTDCLAVVERYLAGEASEADLESARQGAYEVRRGAYAVAVADATAADAAYAAADAAYAAAYATAYAAAYASVNAAATAAAYAFVNAAAAAYAADAAYAARLAAYDEAKRKAREEQVEILVDLIKKGIDTRDTVLEQENVA